MGRRRLTGFISKDVGVAREAEGPVELDDDAFVACVVVVDANAEDDDAVMVGGVLDIWFSFSSLNKDGLRWVNVVERRERNVLPESESELSDSESSPLELESLLLESVELNS
jgi:hypothetical protein